MVIFTLSVFFFYVEEAHGVYIRGVEVPVEAQAGKDVSLRCWVNPWPGQLYSLAWWKDGAQFYRSTATTSSVALVSLFPLPGLTLKEGSGGLGHVVLERVRVAATGSYTCEAVADFPSFSQHLVPANLTIVDPPDTGPLIAGYKIRYYPGEVLAASCTILRAHPVPAVSWFINSHQVEEGRQEVVEVNPEVDLTFTTTSKLTLRLKRHHFINDVINLTCGAQVGQRLWTSTTITTHRARPHKHTRPRKHHDLHATMPIPRQRRPQQQRPTEINFEKDEAAIQQPAGEDLSHVVGTGSVQFHYGWVVLVSTLVCAVLWA
nr:uncharacterized protein LOC128693556 [Cherax quadricarinatus]